MCPDRTDHSRAEARRNQILDAAVDCFRNHGFHGASISQISKSAGMSPGHIYHYFENKEAIVSAIVMRDMERWLTLSKEIRSACNVREAMLERVSEGISECLNPSSAGMQLEVLAEASRNPHISQVVHAADRSCRESLELTLRDVRRAAGHEDSDARIHAMVEVLAAMFDGLNSRIIRNPALDHGEVATVFTATVRDFLDRP